MFMFAKKILDVTGLCNGAPVNLVEIINIMFTVQIVAACNKTKYLK